MVFVSVYLFILTPWLKSRHYLGTFILLKDTSKVKKPTTDTSQTCLLQYLLTFHWPKFIGQSDYLGRTTPGREKLDMNK